MRVIGLTGSIGMGKSRTAEMFAEAGGRVLSADVLVHRLYAAGGAGAGVIAELAPDALTADGAVDRGRLRQLVREDSDLLARVEAAIHPLVRRARDRFVAGCRAEGSPFVVLEIPLLFETGGEGEVDVVVVVTAPAAVQRQRVLARPGMDEESFRALLARQWPDAAKRRRAQHVIDTGAGPAAARRRVREILDTLGLASGAAEASGTGGEAACGS